MVWQRCQNKGYDENKEPSYLQYQDVNNLYRWAMLPKSPVKKFEWIGDTSLIIEEKSDEIYFLDVYFQHLKTLLELHNDLPFLPERIKIAVKLLDKTGYVIHIRNLKQALNHGLVFKEVHRVIKLN